MAKVTITQVKSQIGQSERHRGTLRALGLGKIGRSAEHEESPVLAGMLRKVRHLVKVERMPEKQLNLSNLSPAQPREDRKRVGRGLGSGKGRYSGRGIKGQKSRSGHHKMPAGFEGGQTKLFMRIGKLRGNTSADAMPIGPFRTYTQPINVRDLDRFDAGAEVTPESLVEKGLLKNTKIDVKLLGDGELTKKLTVRVHAISASAREKIEAAGGTVELLREPKVKKVRHHKAKPLRLPKSQPATEEATEDATPADATASAAETGEPETAEEES